MNSEIEPEDWVYLHEGFNFDNVFEVDMVDSFGRVKISAWVERDAVVPFVMK